VKFSQQEAALRRLRAPLLRWYRRARRDLPWRRTRDPYAIWISEVMLQQTRVAVVVPYYARFLARFPDLASLARASRDEVLSLWSGLGYYRRARALHAGARLLVERHGGQLPDDPALLRGLPGIGPYTAGAIASLAFSREEPVLDGNVRRVLSRLLARLSIPDARLWELARALVRGPSPGDLNQALMELGALVCTPRHPDCPACPLARRCAARASGRPEAFPRKKPRPVSRSVRVAVALVEKRGRVLLERPGATSPLRGVWDLPAVELAEGARAAVSLERALRRHGLTIVAGAETPLISHSILDRRLRLETLRCRLTRGGTAARGDLCWVEPQRLATTPVSGATKKILAVCYSGSRGRAKRYGLHHSSGTAPNAASSPAQ